MMIGDAFISYRTQCLFAFFLISTILAAGQASPRSDGSISGRVFLITEDGDLKPARLADIYLLSDKLIGKESASQVFLDENTRELEEETRNLESDPSAALTTSDCRSDLLMITRSVLEATKWAEKNNLSSAVLSSRADENGNFRISGIKLNRATANVMSSSDGERHYYQWEYTVVAKGHAGANDAYWQAEIIVIQDNGKTKWQSGTGPFISGRNIQIKLGTPEKSCLRIPQE